jgi:predicted kinase
MVQTEKGMERPHLLIVCGVPGAGKSTLALHAVNRWRAVSFASEAFADALGAAGRTPSGDLTEQAIAHAYSAMGDAVAASLATNKLVLAVGSFRAPDQRRRFRAIAELAKVHATALRISCPSDKAASRVRARIALGGHGPTERAIRRIDAELDEASDIDIVIANDATIDQFLQRADTVLGNCVIIPS